MITTLTGTNNYQLQLELQRAVAAFVDQYTDLGLEKYDGADLDAQALPSIVQAVPFLAAKRLVILRQPSAQKALTEQLEKLLDKVADSTDLLIVEPNLDKRTSYYKALLAKTDLKRFDELNESALAAWAVDFAHAAGAYLSRPDATYLVQRVGINQIKLSNELTKLANFKPQISRQTIDDLTEPMPQSSVFDLLDAAFAGQIAKALAIYQDQRRQNVDPHAMLAMIAWQLHVLALLKTAAGRSPGDIAAQTKISPYVVRKSAAIATRLSLSTLRAWLQAAHQLDIRLKSTSLDADEALQTYLLTLSQ